MWGDSWANIGPLINHITHRSIYEAILDTKIIVAEMIDEGNQKWPDEWRNKYPKHLERMIEWYARTQKDTG